MYSLPNLTAVARLVGDPARLKMLAALRTEGELTAGDLAAVAGVSPQTASSHLGKLQQGGLITRAHGAYGARHRVFCLTDDNVASAVAALVALATAEPRVPQVAGKHDATVCYGHLGGALGKALLEALLDRELLEPVTARPGWFYDHGITDKDYRVTNEGAQVLHKFDIDIATLQKQRRNFARRCSNTHKPNAHLSGSLADALLKGLRERSWVVPDNSLDGVLVLTEAGRHGLAGHFAVRL